MEALFSLLTGLFFAVAVYLILSKHLIRILLGLVVLGNAVNLLLFVNGRILREIPPIIGDGMGVPARLTANPLPQALILTAIVISFSFFAFLLVLTWRAYGTLSTDNTDDMRVAEPRNDAPPPGGY